MPQKKPAKPLTEAEIAARDDSTNLQLQALIEKSGLTQAGALSRFNEGLDFRPISLSTWKAWLTHKSQIRWRPLDPAYVEHARKAFGAKKSKP